MGHWAAAQALREQLADEYSDLEAEVLDFVDYAMPEVSHQVYKAFTMLMEYGSGLFNTYYKLMENTPVVHPIFEWVFVEKLVELLGDRQPAAVIVTHPFCAQVVSRYKKKTGDPLPLVTCVTDLSSHAEWMNPGTDAYLVGTNTLRDSFVHKGVPCAQICVTGIPVRAEFWSTQSRREKAQEERRLLIMGGGLGFMPQKKEFYDELNALPLVKTTIITGHNRKLYHRLAGGYENIAVVGYTDRVHDYMARSHLMLSKPGGITLFESIFSQLPLLAWEPFLQQEKKNMGFLIESGIGRMAGRNPFECLSAIRGLIYQESALSEMSRRMGQMRSQLERESVRRVVMALTGIREACIS